MFSEDEATGLYSEFAAKLRQHGRRLDGLPLLDALLPYFEYTTEQLMRSQFKDEWLTASVKAQAVLYRAAEIVQPLGITRDDLLLLLHQRMQMRLKEKKTSMRGVLK